MKKMNKLFPNVTSLKKLSGNFNYDKLNVFFKDMKVNVFISFDKEPSILTSNGSSKLPLEQLFKHKFGHT